MSSKIAKYHACYSVLDAKLNSTPELIRSKFMELSKIYHPDNQKTGDARKFMRIKNAYEIVKDAPLSRQSTKYFDFTPTNTIREPKRVNNWNEHYIYGELPSSRTIGQMFLSKLTKLLKR